MIVLHSSNGILMELGRAFTCILHCSIYLRVRRLANCSHICCLNRSSRMDAVARYNGNVFETP